jgi:hypothetical protein
MVVVTDPQWCSAGVAVDIVSCRVSISLGCGGVHRIEDHAVEEGRLPAKPDSSGCHHE